ncbi:MAG: adenylate/guanylate cyclase domain-containing protein [Burkholderiales bacterium]|nr:adenylate/guanylate cyclase domain-containing protein [Burkholderiales bacterium]
MTRSRWFALAVGVAFAILCGILRAADPPQLKLVRELLFDEYQRLSPRTYEPMPVRIVDIDEASLKAIGQWPWPRNELARLVEKLAGLGAASVSFDAVFPEPDRLSPVTFARRNDIRSAIGDSVASTILRRLPDTDAQFAAAIASRRVVLGFGTVPTPNTERPPSKNGFAYTGENPALSLQRFVGVTRNLAAFEDAAAGIGAINVSPQDNQGIIRQVPLFWSDGQRIFPSLAIEALRVAQGIDTILIRSTHAPPAAAIGARIGDFEVPTTRTGELRVRFSRDVPERYVSALRILAEPSGDDLKALIDGHIVLVGTSAVGLLDARATPLAESVPGVSIHAQVIEQILGGVHLVRPDWTDPLEMVWTILLGSAVVVLGTFGGPVLTLLAGGGLAILTFAASWVAFAHYGLLVDPLYPALCALMLHIAMTSFRYLVTDRDKRFVRRAFGRYVSPSVLARLEKDPSALRLGGEERELTVMFMDVRSFTSLSEAMTPTELVEFVNRLLSRLSDEIVAEAGTIDKYIGDSIMAFWNAPVELPDHALRACRAALRMRSKLDDLNQTDAFGLKRIDPDAAVRIGTGLNTGFACVGNVGSENRFNYSALGDSVNVSSRIEGLCKEVGADILASESVVRAAPGLAWLEAGSVALRGRQGDTRVFLLVGDESTLASEPFAVLRDAHENLLRAWASGGPDALHVDLAQCIALAQAHFPWLLSFYKAPGPRLSARKPAPVVAPVT